MPKRLTVNLKVDGSTPHEITDFCIPPTPPPPPVHVFVIDNSIATSAGDVPACNVIITTRQIRRFDATSGTV